MKRIKYGFAVTGLMMVSLATQADPAQGKKLADKSCTRCHDSSVYTRPNRQIRSLNALQHRVNMCEKPASVNWSDKQTGDVVDYLNTEFYHFK